MKKHYLLFITITLFCLSVIAQTERLYTVNAELPCSLITALVQDSVGNIWIGTENGLSKYDGAKFINYTHDSSNSSTLLYNGVSALYVTSKGDVLVGTKLGLQRYDSKYDRFVKIDLAYLDDNEIPVHISSIGALPDGSLVLGTLGTGVFKVNTETWKGSSVISKKDAGMFVIDISVNSDGTLWIAAMRENALKGKWNDNGMLTFQAVPGTGDWAIENVISDAQGNAYYSTQHGVHKVSDKTLANELIFDGSNTKVVSMMFGVDSTLLLGTDGYGVLAYDIKQGKTSDIGFNTGRTDISRSKVRDMLIDVNSNLWLGLYQRGVITCQSQSNQFGYIGKGASSGDFIGSHSVMALYHSPDGALWVVSDNDGIYVETEGRVVHYPQGQNGLPSLITNILKTSDGTVWIESMDKGLSKLEPKSGKCITIDAFRDMRVFDIVEDNNQQLWVATMGNGMYKIDRHGNIQYKAPYTDQRHYTPGADLLHNSWINSLTLSNDGKKLFINTCYGVGCYDLEVGSYVNTFGVNRILTGEMCYDSYQDDEGSLWIATTNGVYRWNASDDKITHYDVNNGLCNNTVVGLTADANDNIWMTTYYGLSKYDKSADRFYNFYAHDGVQGNEFTPRSMCRDADGVIYAGGLNGITVINNIDLAAKAPIMRVADVYLYDEAINYGTESNGKPIIKQRGDDVVYEFDLKDNTFGVELTTDQFNNYNIRYEYSIDGGDWMPVSSGSNKAFFSNLSPGDHTLAFKAISFGTESDVEYMKVHVRPHSLLTWWAILIYFLIAGCIAYVAYRIVRKRREMEAQIEHQRKKDEFNSVTMKFLANIANEIRTPISLITNPIKQLSEIHADPTSKHLFAIIRNNVNHMLLLANQLIDVRKIDFNELVLNKESTEMKGYISSILKLFEGASVSKDVSLTFESDSIPLYADIDRNQFDKVLVNILGNAYKRVEAGGHIAIELQHIEENIQITVSVDSIHMSTEELEHIFDRFYQSENTLSGSGVGLHLASLLVTRHGGTIQALRHSDEEGVSVVIQIPESKSFTEDDAKQAHEVNPILISQIDTKPDYELESKTLKSKPTIVIVENNEGIRSYLHEQLQKQYNVITYSNVKEAMTGIIANRPDLVITEIVFPGGDGISFIKNIRNNININEIPIIVLSDKKDEEDVLQSIGSGVDIYLTKPFSIKLLKSYIEGLLNQRHRLKVIYQGDQIDEEIAATIPDVKTNDDLLMERLTKAINTNLGNQKYTIEDLASDVCISRVHLNRKLKQLTNQSPSAYLRNMRLAKAAEMLRDNPKLTVSDVVVAVGMTSFSHFSHAFKQLYGCSPSEYAEMERHR